MSLARHGKPVVCVLANKSEILLSRFLACHIDVGDEIAFTLPGNNSIGAEIYRTKTSSQARTPNIYQAQIGYVAPPKTDKRNRLFVSAEVQRGSLGISTISLTCDVLREYFYRLPRGLSS
jgi:hypothetical protein